MKTTKIKVKCKCGRLKEYNSKRCRKCYIKNKTHLALIKSSENYRLRNKEQKK